jgi:hypothetical protein
MGALRLFTCTMLLLPIMTAGAAAQQATLKDQLAGVWVLVFADNVAPDGTRRQVFGTNPKGIMMLDASGRYSEMIVSSDRPKFAANNRLKGTPDENQGVIAGTISAFGSWSVNEADKTIVMKIEASLFPNQDGADARRIVINLNADSLKIANPGAGAGGRAEAEYRRAR